jgi:hypothetical protein
VVQRKGISSGMGPYWPFPPRPATQGPLNLGSGMVAYWSVEVDLQLFCPGMACRPAVAPLPEHLRCASGIAHQHHRDRQHQLHHDRRQHFNCWALEHRWRWMFPYCGHHRRAHRLTSSGVTTGWMPWAFQ